MEKEIKSILLLKHYGTGIGDMVRWTASWKSLKEKFPEAKIHMFFWPHKVGTAGEYLIKNSAYIESLIVEQRNIRKTKLYSYTTVSSFRSAFKSLREFISKNKIDLVVDQEIHGLDNSILSIWLRMHGVKTLGVSGYLFKKFFYTYHSISEKEYAKKFNLTLPLDYTEKDYISLSYLGINRDGQQIIIQPKPHKKQNIFEFKDKQLIVGINIGCGPGLDVKKRPDLKLFSKLITLLVTSGFAVVITGTADEKKINELVIDCLSDSVKNKVIDAAGTTDLPELLLLISYCDAFISSDSGPFHLSVGLDVPTIGIFNWHNPSCYHHKSNVRNFVTNANADADAGNIICLLSELLKD